MNIGEAAHASGMSAKKIRHYESIGLIQTAKRRSSGYRQYELADVHRLRFIKVARNVGLSFTDIRELLALWTNRKRSNDETKQYALAKTTELEKRLTDVRAMIDTLRQLTSAKAQRGSGSPVIHDWMTSTKIPGPFRKRRT